MSLITLLVVVVLLGLAVWLVQTLPIPQPFKVAAVVVAVLIILVVLLQLLGLGGAGLRYR